MVDFTPPPGFTPEPSPAPLPTTVSMNPPMVGEVSPFHRVDGQNRDLILESIRTWTRTELLAWAKAWQDYLSEYSDGLGDWINQYVISFQDYLELSNAELRAEVEAVLEQVINNSIELQDAVAAGLVTDGGLFTTALAANYRPRNARTITIKAEPGEIISDKIEAAQLEAAAAGLSFGQIGILPGSYQIDRRIVVDLSICGLYAPDKGVTITTAPGYTDTVAVQVTRSVDNGRAPANNVFNDIYLVGPGESSGVTGILVESATQQISGFTFLAANVRNFENGIDFGTNAYTINFAFGNIWNCKNVVRTIAGSVNMGERLCFIGSNLYNSDNLLQNNAQNARVHFISCSADYLRKQVVANHVGDLVEITGGHVECSAATPDALPWFQWSKGSLRWVGGSMASSDRNGPTNRYIFKNMVPAGGSEQSVMKEVTVTGSYAGRGWADPTSTSPIHVETHMSANGLVIYDSGEINSLTANGGFEVASLKRDRVLVTGSAGTVVEGAGTYDDTNIGLAVSTDTFRTGAQSLKYTKKTNGGGNVYIAVPVEGRSITSINLFATRVAAITGGVFIDFYYGKLLDGVIARVENYGPQRTISTASVAIGSWQGIRNFGIPSRIPAWADHVLIRITSPSPNTIYIDDFTVTSV